MNKFKRCMSIIAFVLAFSLGTQSVFANEYQITSQEYQDNLTETIDDINTSSSIDLQSLSPESLDNFGLSTLEELEDKLVKFEGELDDLEYDAIIEFTGKQDLDKVSESTISTKLNESDMQVTIDSSDNLNYKGARSLATPLSTNSSPATAKAISISATENGTISFNGDQRWYSTTITGRTRLTPELKMAASSDYDLYLYWLDESTMTLYLIASSETYSTAEWLDIIVGSGSYYIRIIGFEGPGNFSLKMHGTDQYIHNEFNNTTATSTALALNNFSVQDSISSPYDYDYFKTTITEERIVTVSLSKPVTGIDVLLIMNGQFYTVPLDQEFLLSQGSYGFVVYSSNGQPSSSPYTLKMSSKIYSNIEEFKVLSVSNDGRYRFQQKISDGKYYVNDTPIDWNYQYTDSFSASYGHYNLGCYHYDMPTKKVMNVAFGSYTTNWSGSSSNSNVMRVFLADTDFTVRRYASGTYGNFIGYTKRDAWLIINPITGKAIDEMAFNYPYYYGGFKASFTPR